MLYQGETIKLSQWWEGEVYLAPFPLVCILRRRIITLRTIHFYFLNIKKNVLLLHSDSRDLDRDLAGLLFSVLPELKSTELTDLLYIYFIEIKRKLPVRRCTVQENAVFKFPFLTVLHIQICQTAVSILQQRFFF